MFSVETTFASPGGDYRRGIQIALVNIVANLSSILIWFWWPALYYRVAIKLHKYFISV